MTGRFLAALQIFFVISLSILGTWMLHGFMFRDGLAYIPGDLGDSRLVNLFLEHNYGFFVTGAVKDYWNPSWIFYPLPQGLALSDVLTGVSWNYIIFRVFGFDYLTSFQFWIISNTILNYFCCFLLFKLVGVRSFAAASGAYVYAFSMARIGFLGHPQLTAGYYVPLSLLGLFLFFKETKKINAGLWLSFSGICLALQLWGVFYFAWFLSVIVAVGAAFAFWHKDYRASFKRKISSNALGIVLSGVVAGLIATPLLYRYWQISRTFGQRHWSDVAQFLPRVKSHIMPHPGSYLYGWYYQDLVSGMGANFEMFLFSGFIILFCPFALLYVRKRYAPESDVPKVLFWLAPVLVLFFLFFITRFTKMDSLWNLIYHVFPGAGGVRAAGRIIHVLLIPIGFTFALVIGLVQTRFQGLTRVLVIVLLLVAVFIENLVDHARAFSKAENFARINRTVAEVNKLEKNCDTFYLHKIDNDYATHLDAMWASLITGVPTVNGYSGFVPRKYYKLGLHETDQSDIGLANQWLRTFPGQTGQVCFINTSAPSSL